MEETRRRLFARAGADHYRSLIKRWTSGDEPAFQPVVDARARSRIGSWPPYLTSV
jgi:hypothetical protein